MGKKRTYQEIMVKKAKEKHQNRIANNRAVIEAMTDEELSITRDMILEEINFRQGEKS